jgi:hypothetical protein
MGLISPRFGVLTRKINIGRYSVPRIQIRLGLIVKSQYIGVSDLSFPVPATIVDIIAALICQATRIPLLLHNEVPRYAGIQNPGSGIDQVLWVVANSVSVTWEKHMWRSLVEFGCSPPCSERARKVSRHACVASCKCPEMHLTICAGSTAFLSAVGPANLLHQAQVARPWGPPA